MRPSKQKAFFVTLNQTVLRKVGELKVNKFNIFALAVIFSTAVATYAISEDSATTGTEATEGMDMGGAMEAMNSEVTDTMNDINDVMNEINAEVPAEGGAGSAY